VSAASGALPYWRLSGFYLLYFASIGVLLPYWGPYLAGQGFSAAQIGELLGLVAATRLIAPYLWGWLADRSGRHLGMARLGCLLGALGFVGVFFAEGYVGMALAMAAFSFFWNAALPQFEAVTFAHLGGAEHRYSRIRLWGSLGFIATVTALGALLDARGAQILPLAMFALLLLLWLESLWVPEPPAAAAHDPAAPGLWAVLARREVRVLLAAVFLMQLSHGPYYSFFSLYLQDLGYSKTATGLLWTAGVVAEVGVFLLLPRLVPRIGLPRLLLASLLLAALRWLLLAAFADHLWLLLPAQALHAATFGIYHAVAISLICRHFPGPLRARGQALYASLGFGGGVAAGSYLAGRLWESVSPQAGFWAAALAALLAAGLVGWGLLGWGLGRRGLAARGAD